MPVIASACEGEDLRDLTQWLLFDNNTVPHLHNIDDYLTMLYLAAAQSAFIPFSDQVRVQT